jgi:hypothetical protein
VSQYNHEYAELVAAMGDVPARCPGVRKAWVQMRRVLDIPTAHKAIQYWYTSNDGDTAQQVIDKFSKKAEHLSLPQYLQLMAEAGLSDLGKEMFYAVWTTVWDNHSQEDLKSRIPQLVKEYNEHAEPFAHTYWSSIHHLDNHTQQKALKAWVHIRRGPSDPKKQLQLWKSWVYQGGELNAMLEEERLGRFEPTDPWSL